MLSRSDLPADALAGSTLAARAGGPLLLTGSGALDTRVADELRHGPDIAVRSCGFGQAIISEDSPGRITQVGTGDRSAPRAGRGRSRLW